ncbi:MAG: SH3 domain-containing protein [Defluviitaleaceae bacterium]|nr:SH3 domain-containing protein [Defluviitaleaceae bacterium]MCL2239226.1 SH3 domain-containing protein [Defluviitaleaceae bacterium]
MKKIILCLLLVAWLSPMTVRAFAVDLSCWVDDGTHAAPETAEDATAFITLEALNLRPVPGTHAPRITMASRGSVVQVTDVRDGIWYAVIYNGMRGYMYAEFLEKLDTTPFVPPDLGNLAPVEILDWHSANVLLTRHTAVTIIDVRTGISWQVARFGGELHADVETVTAEDTANMHRAFDYTWTWEPRPVLVIIDGRTIAASINGMPHGIVTNFRNNVHGHFCLHFFGSLAHGAASVDLRHHNAVMEAFFTAIQW